MSSYKFWDQLDSTSQYQQMSLKTNKTLSPQSTAETSAHLLFSLLLFLHTASPNVQLLLLGVFYWHSQYRQCTKVFSLAHCYKSKNKLHRNYKEKPTTPTSPELLEEQ